MKRILSLKAPFVALGLVAGWAGTATAADPELHTSPMGFEFALVQEPSIPIVAIEMIFRGGARVEIAGKEGAANYTTWLMNEGAGDLDAAGWSKRSDDLSARISFSSRLDRAELSARFLSETLDDSVDFLEMTITQPRFDPEPMERARQSILSDIREAAENPESIASKTWWSRAFPDHIYGRERVGTAETVKTITVDDVRAVHQKLYTSANAYTAIVGDIGPERAGAMVDQILGRLPKGELLEYKRTDDVPPPGLHVVEMDVPQSVAIFGHKGLQRSDPDFFAAYVMNQVLGGGGFSSRLMIEVREKRGLAYSVYSYLNPENETELFMGGVQTANERISESLDVIRAEWTRMAEEGATEEELDEAKTFLTGSYPLRFDSNSKIANIMVFLLEEGLGIDYIKTRNARIDAVTQEDVKRAAQRILDTDALSIVVVGKPVGL